MRGTLEKLDGISAAFVNRGQVMLLMSAEETYNEEEIAKILKRYKSTVKSSSKVASPL
ncbi:hypothetical protein N9096_01645 [bacterium]|nr:hypothetical protein [Verrucomicrobiaceae bacterium]MDA7614978.1 hypothetical protein [Akkermansiaceae bacterium]MDB2429055.1 hypothetical protein [Akkermansiaceae bacterium]MDB4512657.1 hypothetical protein [bacterium]MDB4745314.1 hypothetical protein [bacterium]